MTSSETEKRYGGKKGKKYPHLQRAAIRKCIVCGKEFRATKDHKNYKQKRCSRTCYEKDWIQNIRPRMQDNPGMQNEKNPAWKGDGVGYAGIHKWVTRKLGKPQECWRCGDTKKRKYEWASIGHTYDRDLKKWTRLCTECHRDVDLNSTL